MTSSCKCPIAASSWQCNLVPRVSHLPAQAREERGFAWAGRWETLGTRFLTMKCQAIGTFELSLKNCWLGKKTRVTSVVLITCVCIKRVEFRETVRIFPQGQLNCPYQEGVSIGEGGGGWGGLKKFLYGEAPPRGPTPYPFIYHFSRKRYPFRIPSIEKWYPFQIPCLELCNPFNCCKLACLQTSPPPSGKK